MALTRYQLEQALVSPTRIGGIMAELGLVAEAYVDRSSADLNEAIASALESIGVVPEDRSSVSDDDLAKVSDHAVGRFIDLTEIRAIEGLVLWLAARPRAERFPDWQIDRVGTSGEWVLSILKQKQARYDATWKGGGPQAAPMERGIRHNLRMRRRRRHDGRHAVDD